MLMNLALEARGFPVLAVRLMKALYKGPLEEFLLG